ncbi:MAG: GxxExxY protein [Mongoliitalea sp.]
MNFIHKSETYRIIGAAMEVHKALGNGFLEKVYHEALKIEFERSDVKFTAEHKLPVIYKGIVLPTYYYADFLCYDTIIVEIKALSELSSEHYSQVLNYLKASKLKVGLLINFGSESLEYKRIIL